MRNFGDDTERTPRIITYSSLFWLFMLGSIIGFILEGLWSILRGRGWENHSATVWGPFCIVYGLGAVALYVAAAFISKRSLPLQFAVCGILGSAVEYLASAAQELCFGSTSWDYSDQFLNIGGRVSFRMTLIWGFLGVLFIKLLYPFFSRALGKLNSTAWRISCAALSLFMALNLSLTAFAVIRWRERLSSIPASSNAEELIDVYYNDGKMEDIFNNMVFSD